MDDIDLDHINADPEYNLQSLCENDNPDGDTSPYELSNTSCKYYEPCNVKSALSGNDLSMFGLIFRDSGPIGIPFTILYVI